MNSVTHKEAWETVVDQFRRVCILRRDGNVTDSRRILEQELPGSISAWSRLAPQAPAAKRESLERMFQEEQRRIDHAWMVQKLVVSRVAQEIVPSLCSKVAEQIDHALARRFDRPAPSRSTPATPSRRVAFDDIQGMIDQVWESQKPSSLHAVAA